MVTLLQRLLSQTSPVVLAVDSLGHLERDIEVPALDSKVKPRRLVLHKVEGNLKSQTVSKAGDDAEETGRDVPRGIPSSAGRR